MATGGTDTDTLSDETFDCLCNVCKRKGKTTEAKKYCTDCQYCYCLTCVKVHDDLPLLTGHNVVDSGTIQKGSANNFPMMSTEKCDKHGLKPVDMYCKNHDQVGCSTCIAAGHGLCKDIFYVPDYVQNMASACNPETAQKTLASTEETLKVAVKLCEQEKQRLLERKVESIQNVRQVRKEIDEKLDELEQASVAEIENKYEEMISKIEEEIKKFRDAKGNVVSAKDKLAAADYNTSQIFVSTKKGQSVVMEAEGILHKKKITCFYEDISISTDTKFKEMLEQLESLLKVTSNVLLKGMKKYAVKDQSDSYRCDIVSSCILEDGTIILADKNNKKLKRLDRSTYSVRDDFNLPGCPFQVCSINNQEIAVSYKMKEIMFISLGNQMAQKSLNKTDFDCYALAYTNEKLYIANKFTSVYIYSLSGQRLKQLRVTGLIESWTLDIYSHYGKTHIKTLAVNDDGSKIYIANAEKGLLIMDNNGKVVFRDILSAQSVCHVYLTRTGTVLVCTYSGISNPIGLGTHIVQLGPDGEQIGRVQENATVGLRTVCCNQQMSKMIVSARRTNEIEVCDLV